MFCSRCGNKIDLMDNYCRICGKNMNKKTKLKSLSYIMFLIGLPFCITLSPIAFIFGVIGLILSLVSNKETKSLYFVYLNLLLIILSLFVLCIQIYLIGIYKSNYNLKIVGNDYVGYIKVPSNLSYIYSTNENKIEYYDEFQNYFSLYKLEDVYITVKEYSNNLIDKYHEYYDNVEFKSYTYNDYYVVCVTVYDEDILINNWIFKEKNGDLHHITIKSLKEKKDNFELIKTYNLKG